MKRKTEVIGCASFTTGFKDVEEFALCIFDSGDNIELNALFDLEA